MVRRVPHSGSAVTCSLEEVEVDLRVEDDALVLHGPNAAPRTGWVEACRKLAAAGDDVHVLPEFTNEADVELTWSSAPEPSPWQP